MLAAVLFTLLAIAVPDRALPPANEQPKAVREQLVGEWKFVSGVMGGNEKKEADGTVLTFTRTDIQIREKNQNRVEEATYVLDEKKKPATIDIMPKNGPDKRVQGILKLDGDTLTLCFAHGGEGERPLDFVSPTLYG